MELFKPGDLMEIAVKEKLLPVETATDTETSGLFADDGARVSTVSVAWEDRDGRWYPYRDHLNYKTEFIAKDRDPVVVCSLAWPFDQGVTGKPEDKGQETLWPEAENLPKHEWHSMLDWLSRNALDYHNAKFDLEKLRVGTRLWPGVDLQDRTNWDSQNVNHLLWPLFPHPETFRPTTSLKPTCEVLFDEPVGDDSKLVKAYLRKHKLPSGRYDLVPWDIIGPYADLDARLTIRLKIRQIWEIQQGRAGTWLGDPGDVLDKIDRRLQTMLVLYREEMRGLPYDEAESNLSAMKCVRRASAIEQDLPFSPPTGPAAKEYFFTDKVTKKGEQGLDLVPYGKSQKTDEPSLTAEIVQRMVADRVPNADKWLDYSKVTTAESMWYRGYAEKMGTDGRLRTCFRQNGTVSTRFSVERINLQAIPQDYRLSDYQILDGIKTPRDHIISAVKQLNMDDLEWTVYELDLKQAELRVAALFAQEEKMLQMFVEGTDLHTYTTRELFPDVDPEDPLFKSKWRQVGKRGNFSLCFGSEWETFKAMVSKETGIRLQDSESMRIVRDWNVLYPSYRRAIKRHSQRVARRQAKTREGWLDLINKERRWFGRYEETHKAFNQRVQGNLAQFGIDWMLMSDDFLRKQGLDEFGAGLILTIHDSQMLLLPKTDEGKAMAEKCASFGDYLWTEWFPQVPGGVDYKDWG